MEMHLKVICKQEATLPFLLKFLIYLVHLVYHVVRDSKLCIAFSCQKNIITKRLCYTGMEKDWNTRQVFIGVCVPIRVIHPLHLSSPL